MRITPLSLAFLLAVAGCAPSATPAARQAVSAANAGASAPPPGPTHTIPLPNGHHVTCNDTSGALCVGPTAPAVAGP